MKKSTYSYSNSFAIDLRFLNISKDFEECNVIRGYITHKKQASRREFMVYVILLLSDIFCFSP